MPGPPVDNGRRFDLPATFGQRVLARAIDLVIVSSVILLLGGATVSNENGTPEVPRWVILVFAAVFVAYEGAMVANRGATVGKLSTRIAVVSTKTGGLPAVVQALLRALVPIAGWLVFPALGPLLVVLVYLTSATDRAFGRGLPDRVAGTVVVQRDPGRIARG